MCEALPCNSTYSMIRCIGQTSREDKVGFENHQTGTEMKVPSGLTQENSQHCAEAHASVTGTSADIASCIKVVSCVNVPRLSALHHDHCTIANSRCNCAQHVKHCFDSTCT